MQKYKAKKEVIEQLKSKLENIKNTENKGNLGEISAFSDDSSKLQASEDNETEYNNGFISGLMSKNIESGIYFIYDNEEINKSISWNNVQPIKIACKDGITRTYYKRVIKDEDKAFYHAKEIFNNIFQDYTEKEKKRIFNFKKKCKNPFITEKGYMFYYEGDRYSKEYLNKLKNGDKGEKKEYQKLLLEIKHASLLADNGFSVYLPKEPNNLTQFDAIVNNIAIDFKYLMPDTKIERVEKDTKDSFEQGQGMSLFVDKNSKLNQNEIEKMALKVANNTKKDVKVIDIYFEKNNQIVAFDIRKKIIPLKKGDFVAHNEIPSCVNQASLNSLTKTSDSLSKCFLAKENSQLNNNVLIKNVNKNLNKSLTYSGYKLQGRTRLYGMNISIENKKGSYRSGVDSDGHRWRIKMNYDYGYIRGTEGVDGDHVDAYIGPDKNADKVYIIHQNDPKTHKYDEDKCMLCFSNADEAKKGYMSQYDRPGFFGSMEIMTIDQFKSYVFSHLGKKIHKSFDVMVTDITENNKSRKIEQLQKSLYATLENKPFIINHIPADDSKRLSDIVLRINNFDKNKIEKAVHSMAMSLDSDLPLTGEAFMYKSQEELTNQIVKELTEKTNSVYSFIIDYFDLPEIRVVSKAYLYHKGKIVYDPETGVPIKKEEWERFIKHLEEFLNRNYKGVGEKIVISAESLGRMLDRLGRAKSLSEIKKMPLKELEVNHRKFDWISKTAKNMQNALGESVKDRRTQASIQIAIDSAAQRVTRVTDNMRNDIQQIIIDGVKNHQSKSKVSQNLFDKCVGLNRDFQKIADTEIQSTVNMSYLKEEVYNTPEGEKVYFKRFEHDDEHTCKKCLAIKGVIALWSDVPLPDEHIEDEFAEYAIWEGKTDGEVPATILHPYCRGNWYRYYPRHK